MGNRLSLPQKLHKAVKDNNVQSVQDVCKRAVTAGPAVIAATLEHRDDKGRTPLLLAAGRGHVQIAKLLLQHGANLQHMRRCGNGGSALHEAAAAGSEAVAKLLLEKGADPFQENFAGKMALEVASTMKHAALVRLLEAQGLMKGYVELKVPALAGMSSAWQTRWVSVFCRHPNPAESRHGERLEAWLYPGPENSQPKCRIVLEGCHAVVAGPELKLTLRNDHVEPDNAYCPRCPDGSYIVSLRAAPHYDSHFKLLVRCLSASKQMHVAHYNGVSDTQLPALQSGFASADNPLDAGSLLSPASANRIGASVAVMQEPTAPLLDATPSTPRGTMPMAVSRSPKPPSPGPSRWDATAEAPDSTPASDSWGTIGPLHTYRPSRNSSQPPSPSSHYYQTGADLLTPTSSQPASPSAGYFSSPSHDGPHPSLPGSTHITPPSLPFCHVSPTSSASRSGLGSHGANVSSASQVDRRTPGGARSPPHSTSPSNHYYHDPRRLLHSDHSAAASQSRHSARFASQPPSPSSGYYPQPLFGNPSAPEPNPAPQMPASARYHRPAPREGQQPPSPAPSYFPHSRSVSDMQNLLLQHSPTTTPARPGHNHRGSMGSLDTSSIVPPPLSPGPNYFVTASGPSTTTGMTALPGETDEQFARRLASALWQSVNQQSGTGSRSSPPPFMPPGSATPSAPPTARSHFAPLATPRNPGLESSPAPPNTARQARADCGQPHNPIPSAPPAFSCSGSSLFDDLTTCVICMSRPREAGFLHGETVHNCACRECAKLIPSGSSCPICRQPIERVLGIY